MIRRFLAGLLLIAGGAVMAVGVFQNWSTLPGGQDVNGFTMGSTSIDAVVSFAVAAVLALIGLGILISGGAIARGLGFLFSVLGVIWAAEIVFVMSSLNHDIDHLVPAVSLVRHLQIGYFLVAGGALGGFLGGLLGMTVPRRTATNVEPAMATPVTRQRASVPLADRAAAHGAAWGPVEDRSEAPAPRDAQTPADVWSSR